MSRTRRAGVAAAFGYAQFAVSFVTGILLVPFVLRQVGSEAYGVWLAFGELLAYSAMVDLGVLNVLPWLLAEEDGRGDRAAMRAVISGGVVLAVSAALLFGVLAVGLLTLAPALTGVSEGQRALVVGPFLLLVGAMVLAYPLRTFYASLMGLQDFAFTGTVSVLQGVLGAAITVGMLAAGQGLYALAAGAGIPSVLACAASLLRLRKLAPDLLHGWRMPPFRLVRSIAAQGLGSWMGALGWRMVAASNTIVVLAVAGPEAAVVYAMTAKLGDILTQVSWQLPDSGLVGLAQLKGEGRPQRVREVVVALLRLTMIGSGAVACAVLAFNPAFVTLWVGGERFGGMALNALLAVVVLGVSLSHGLYASGATLGMRVQAGWATLVQGAVHLGLAVLLGRALGLAGVALAGATSAFLVAYPAGVWMLERTTGLTHAELWRQALGPWAVRGVLLLLLGLGVGAGLYPVSPWLPLALAPALGLLYLWAMRPLFATIPLPERIRPLLARIRLVPG